MQFWREAGLDERIAIIGAGVIFLVFIVGWGYLLQMAAHLDAIDRLAK